MKKKSARKKDTGLSLRATTALIIIIFLFGFGGTMWYYAIHKVVYVRTYDIHIELVDENRAGFNVDPTLDFGKLPVYGGQVKKFMNLGNDQDFPVLVSIQVKGDAAQFVQLEDNDFTLEPGEVKKLSVYAIVPENQATQGIYTGKAKITFLRS